MKSSETILGESWSFFKQHHKLLIGFALPMVILNGYLTLITPADALDGIYPMQYYPLLGLLMISVYFFYVMTVLAYNDNAQSTVSEYLKRAVRKARSLIFVYLLTTLATIAGLILFIIPGIFVAFATMFSGSIVLFESERGVAALKKSYRYVRRSWMMLMRKIAYFTLITIVVVLVQFGLMYFISHAFAAQILVEAINVVLSIVSCGYFYLVYREFRSQDEIATAVPQVPLTPPTATV